MADSTAGVGKTQDEPEASCKARKSGNRQKTKKLKMTGECQKDTGAGLKEFLVKAGTFEQQYK